MSVIAHRPGASSTESQLTRNGRWKLANFNAGDCPARAGQSSMVTNDKRGRRVDMKCAHRWSSKLDWMARIQQASQNRKESTSPVRSSGVYSHVSDPCTTRIKHILCNVRYFSSKQRAGGKRGGGEIIETTRHDNVRYKSSRSKEANRFTLWS